MEETHQLQVIAAEHLIWVEGVAVVGLAEPEVIQAKAHLFLQQVNPFRIEGASFVKTHHTSQMFAPGEACDGACAAIMMRCLTD